VSLLKIETAQLESLLLQGHFQVGTTLLYGLHRGGLRDPETGMHFAAFDPEMYRHLTEGIGMELQLRLLGPALQHPAQAAFHLDDGRLGLGRWRQRGGRGRYRRGFSGAEKEACGGQG